MLGYRLVLAPDDNGTILVTSPDFPLVTYGGDEAEAMSRATDAAGAIPQSLIDHRGPIPVPPRSVSGGPMLRLPLQVALKVQLYQALVAAGLTRADLQRTLGGPRESVDRLFRLEHKSGLEQVEAAFQAPGKEVEVSVRAAA